MKFQAYLRLMRFDKPIGIILLWWPTAWALWIADRGAPSVSVLILFLMGTITMRAAGCVMNDIADRHIDGHVKRTQYRPLISGAVSFIEALGVLLSLLLFALWILLQLPPKCFYYALAAVGITLAYPFCKRFITAPQMVLGIAFSMSILMAYVALGVPIDITAFLLVFINCLWVISYDTMYAMNDKEDDIQIGVQSTAILFGRFDVVIIGCLQIIFHSLWLIVAWAASLSPVFIPFWLVAAIYLIFLQIKINTRDPQSCFQAFKWNSIYGLIMWLGLFFSLSQIT